jgi:SAM-dependent methyltransferase
MDRFTQPEFQGVALDTQTIPQDRLDIDNKERSNLFPWNGQFSPQLIEVLLQTYAKAGCYVLDPFLGSGTVLYEAGRLGYPTFGAEINPAAFKMASTYSLMNVNLAKRRRILEDVADLLDDLTPDAAPLFATSRTRHDGPLHEALARQAAAASDRHARGLLETLIVLLNVGDREPDQRTVQATWSKLRDIVLALPASDAPLEVVNCDARSLPLPTGRVDIVVTSPPYINVFNYHQQYRKSLELMGWDLLEVAKSEIGSNRKHRGNRFLTVTQYCLDMLAVFEELRRVCKPGARIVIVVGRESNVRKTVFLNGEIVAGLAVRCAGFHFPSRQERVFQNRFGEMIYEDILHFTLHPQNGRAVVSPSELAREILTAALKRTPADSASDLHDALKRIDEVPPSPLYRPNTAAEPRPTGQVV